MGLKVVYGTKNKVWEGRWNGTVPVAVKKLKSGAADPNDFLVEAQIMKKLSDVPSSGFDLM
ncbi:Tyrosine protein-kinase src-2 [Parelaphostrongylus tenuis]|uniref:Tyrosine protein-kinase src-2 n=1 Tax=Parelaphostrongylus tenuis TaxID=148309 RepID=A0AAD5WDF9_PARTN|nr:Tyrosine protein-kinase src-2 [Parelaphostrongylus tenuis]